jgi:hypothetical protein
MLPPLLAVGCRLCQLNYDIRYLVFDAHRDSDLTVRLRQ